MKRVCDPPYGQTPEIKPIPQQRVIRKMDEYMSHRDYDGAERHLLYWLEEARLGRDRKGQLLIYNELVGHYRKTGDREKAQSYGEEAVRLLNLLEMEDSISAGTTYVNVGTACNAFGENEQAIAYFEKARAIYESTSVTRHDLLGGLYNNMALACFALGRYDEAAELYKLALGQMGEVEGGALEQAVTYLNMADVVEKQTGLEDGEERICDYLDRASELLDSRSVERDGYYAYVCEKCAPVFEYYGYFLAAQDLKTRAEEIYGRKDD